LGHQTITQHPCTHRGSCLLACNLFNVFISRYSIKDIFKDVLTLSMGHTSLCAEGKGDGECNGEGGGRAAGREVAAMVEVARAVVARAAVAREEVGRVAVVAVAREEVGRVQPSVHTALGQVRRRCNNCRILLDCCSPQRLRSRCRSRPTMCRSHRPH